MEVGASETKNFCLKREKNRRNAARSKYKEAPRSRKSLWGKVVNSKGENWIETVVKSKGAKQRPIYKEPKNKKKLRAGKQKWKKRTMKCQQDTFDISRFSWNHHIWYSSNSATQTFRIVMLSCSLRSSCSIQNSPGIPPTTPWSTCHHNKRGRCVISGMVSDDQWKENTKFR